jgi:hypothetical protein
MMQAKILWNGIANELNENRGKGRILYLKSIGFKKNCPVQKEKEYRFNEW